MSEHAVSMSARARRSTRRLGVLPMKVLRSSSFPVRSMRFRASPIAFSWWIAGGWWTKSTPIVSPRSKSSPPRSITKPPESTPHDPRENRPFAANLRGSDPDRVLMTVLTLSSDSFLTTRNLLNIPNQNAPLAIMASAITLVIIVGGFDLSLGRLLAWDQSPQLGWRPTWNLTLAP